MVPPVPAALTKASTSPCVCSQISGPGTLVVRLRIGKIVELIHPYGVFKPLGMATSLLLIVHLVPVGHWWDKDHLRTEGAKQFDLLARLVVGHVDEAGVSACVAHMRQPYTCIACRALDHHAAGLQSTFLLRPGPPSRERPDPSPTHPG